MQRKDVDVSVFLIPEGEKASLSAYEKLVKFLEGHEDLHLTIYRGPNKHDGTWSLVLIGEKTSLSRYREQIQQILSEVHAEPLVVPFESVLPLVERFLVTQAEMLLNDERFVKKHHPKEE